jgi:predicted ATPase
MELLATLPHSRERDVSELELRALLGTSWMALKGWPAPEVWSCFHPALALAKSLERNDALLPIYSGLMQHVMSQGRVAEALSWAEEMLHLAKATGDADLLIMGHALVCNCNFWMGKHFETLEHGNNVLALYDDEKHHHLVDLVNHDPKTVAGNYSSMSTWMLGYPDQAVRINNEKDTHARRLGHPFDLGFALTTGSGAFDFRCEPDRLRRHAEECDRLGRENSMPVFYAILAPIRLGVASIREAKPEDGIAPLRAAVMIWDQAGGKLHGPYTKAVLAEGMALTGEVDNALQLIDEQIEQVERPGWKERVHYAEILRLKGWMLTLKDDLAGAEKSFLASLDWAREQQAKSWELRTSTSLARLWQGQGKGKGKEALDLLKPIYDWFTEGFDTKDLKEAKALLDELES